MTHIWSVLAGALAVLVITYCVYRAVMRARTPQGAVGWVVFLIAAPWIAVPVFLLLGRNRFREFAVERQRSLQLRTTLAVEALGFRPQTASDGRLHAFERLVGLPAVTGNGLQLLIDGEATFDAIFAAIDACSTYACIQFYTIADDKLGNQLAARLIAAARRGVAVRVLYDGVGSYALSRSYLDRLRDAGVQIAAPRLARWPTWRFQINFRNHRKCVILDGQIGFLGGHNVADDYLGGGSRFPRWRDTHVRMRGPVVSQLQLAFAEDWHWATGESLADLLNWDAARDKANMTSLVVPTGPGDDLDTGTLFFVLASSEAKSRLWLASPYFVPDGDVSSALSAAALRGVDVRLIVPENSDNFLTGLAAFAYFDSIRKAGVQVYRYANGFMHQKVLLIDDDVACVGTANLDNRSFRLNFESMVVVHDSGFAAQVEVMLQTDIQASATLDRSLKDQPPIIRFGAPIARLLAPIL